MMERRAACSAGVAGNARILAAAGRQWPAYTRVMQTMHWGTVTLLLCIYAAAWMIDDAPNAADRARLLMLHRSLGITLLLVTGLRLVIRYRTRIPPLPRGLPAAQRMAAKLSAIALYAMLIVQPVLGLAASVLHGDRVVLFGSFVLPRLLPKDRTLTHALFQVHGVAASAFLAVIGLHIAAALYHHFVRRDHVLAGMLPGVSMTPRGSGSVS